MAFPTSTIGWIIWIFCNFSVGAIGIMILVCFNKQAEINVKNEPTYIKAKEILRKAKKKKKPRSYAQYMSRIYTKKGLTIFVSSVFSVIAIGQAILTYDYIKLISYTLVIIIQLIFGTMQMKETENFLTNEWYEYALDVQEEQNIKMEDNNVNNNQKQEIQ